MNSSEPPAGESLPPGRRAGLVTLLFTDVVGSTALKQSLGDNAGVALVQEHHALLRKTLTQFPEGQEISTAGDSFFLVFTRPSEGVRFALLLQSGLREFNQGRVVPLQDRVGLVSARCGWGDIRSSRNGVYSNSASVPTACAR